MSINYNVPTIPSASVVNSSATPLGANETFTGIYEFVVFSASVVVSLKTDQDCTLYVDFSTDGVNIDSTLSFPYVVGKINPPHRITSTRMFARARVVNGSVAQSYMRLQFLMGSQTVLNSALNSTIAQNADAIVVRSVSEEIPMAEGKFEGYSIVNKFGLNPDIDQGSTTEDIWGGDGAYTGWATSAQTLEVFSSSTADTNSNGTGLRSIRIIGLDSNYDVISETVNLAGQTSVFTTQSFLRAHTATGITAGSGGVNAGTITVRQSTTTANIMLTMGIGRNQTNNSGYTVPAGYTAYMRTLHVACGTTANAALDGNIWTRPFGGIFRSRRPFFISNNFRLSDDIYGGLIFTEKTDIIIRINSCTANNTPVNSGYDLILARN